jgi:hypothetical protein
VRRAHPTKAAGTCSELAYGVGTDKFTDGLAVPFPHFVDSKAPRFDIKDDLPQHKRFPPK